MLGPLTAGVVAIGVSLFAGYAHPWLLAVFVLVWRGIQDYGTSPLVMARGIEIHPALVIFGVLAGGRSRVSRECSCQSRSSPPSGSSGGACDPGDPPGGRPGTRLACPMKLLFIA